MMTETETKLYTRWGEECRIVGYCGKVKPKWAAVPMMLVKLVMVDGFNRFAFATNLRADGGINAIEDAIDAAPRLNLTAAEEKVAVKEAE